MQTNNKIADISQLYELVLDPEYVWIKASRDGTNNEGPINLLLEDTGPHSKMYIHQCQELTVEIVLPRAIELKAWGVRSANDFPDRNPAAIDMYFKENEKDAWQLGNQIKDTK